MGIRICPKCGGKVSTSRNNCIHCGYVFPTTKTCPDCGEEIDINAKECPICGYPFEQEAINEAPVQPEPVLEEVKEEPVLEEVKEEPVLEEVKEEEVLEEVKQEELVEAVPIAPVKTVEVVSNEVIASDALRCPYCNEPDLMEIGVDYFMCNTCKGRFLNTSDQKASAVAAAVPLVEAPVAAPLVEAPAEQPVLEEVQEQPVLEEVKEAPASIEAAQPAEEPAIQEPVIDEPAQETNEDQPVEEAKPKKEKAPKEKGPKGPMDKKKLFIIGGAAIGVVAISLALLTPLVFVPQSHYSKGMDLMRNNIPMKAAQEFEKCGNYRDAQNQFEFAYARMYFNKSDYLNGISLMLSGGGTVVAKFSSSTISNAEIPSQTLSKKSDTLMNPEVEGYSFVSKSFVSYAFTKDNRKVTLKFNTTWKALSNKLTLTFKNSSYGTVYVDGNVANGSTSYTKKYTTGTEITLKASPKSSRKFDGWYVDDQLLSTEKNYNLIMPGHDYSIVAKFSS